jgi:protein AATF/BFR2
LEDDDDDDPFALVDDEEDNDPFAAKETAGFDSGDDLEEDDEEEHRKPGGGDEVDESDEAGIERLSLRGSKKSRGQASGSENEDLSDADSNDLSDKSTDVSAESSDVEMDSIDEDEEEDNASSVSSPPSPPTHRNKPTRNSLREEFQREAQSASTAVLASALSAAINDDVKKGQAVKQQRQTFDRLLDARIKLQKGIVAMEDFPSETITEEEIKSAAGKAEEAALALWSTIDSIRCSILNNHQHQAPQASKHTPPKRKFQALKMTSSTPLSHVWEHTTSLEVQAQPHRRTILDRWHSKTQPARNASTDRASKLFTAHQQPASRLSDVLDTYLLSTSTTDQSDRTTFDDTLFYQSLLRELVASRTSLTTSNLSSSAALPPKLHPRSSNKPRVDTKASKGRKIRYTVHEKLENFMAAEDRNTWTDAARREFFGSLLGGGNLLSERVADGEEDEADDDAEVEALRLFSR